MSNYKIYFSIFLWMSLETSFLTLGHNNLSFSLAFQKEIMTELEVEISVETVKEK